jgi:putative MATE family efflux protein
MNKPPLKEINTRTVRNLHQGSIAGNLVSLSWPSIVSNGLNVLGPTVDMIWLAKLGTEAIAAVGIAGMVVFTVNALMMGLYAGLRSMVSRFMGAGDEQGAIHVVRQAMSISLAISVILAIIGIFSAESILRALGVEEAVVIEGGSYLRIQFIGMAAMSFRFMIDNTMQASGDTRTPMKLALIFRLFHITLCPFLIFGWWFFPALGVQGAAITNVLTQSLGTALGLWFLVSGRTNLKVTFTNFRLDFDIIWRLIKIGIPASVMGIQMQLSQFALTWLIVPFGTLAVAAHSLCQRVEMLILIPLFGFGISSGILVGHNLGARLPERAVKTGWTAVLITGIIMAIISLSIFLWAETILSIFTTAPDLLSVAGDFLRIAAVGYLFMPLVMVLQQSISGSGDTLPPMIFMIIMMWIVQLPLAYFLSRIPDMGVYGIRWAMVSSVLAGASIFIVYFRSGRWRQKRI